MSCLLFCLLIEDRRILSQFKLHFCYIGSIPNLRSSHFLSSIHDLCHFKVRILDFRYFQIVLCL